MLTKKKIIQLLASLKERGDISSRSWARLLGITVDAYNNALYKGYLSDDIYFKIVTSLRRLIKEHFIELDFDELGGLA